MLARVALICARKNSKGLPGKNVAMVGGRTLVEWTILQAQQTGLFNDIVVTSDDERVLHTATQLGSCRIVERPAELADDHSAKFPAILHALSQFKDIDLDLLESVVDLDVTAITRSIDDIRNAVRLREEIGCSSVITVCESRRSPYFNVVEYDEHKQVVMACTTSPAPMRRQDAPKTFDMNAAVYVWNPLALRHDPKAIYSDTRLFVMPQNRSIDVDSDSDLQYLRWLVEVQGINPLVDRNSPKHHAHD